MVVAATPGLADCDGTGFAGFGTVLLLLLLFFVLLFFSQFVMMAISNSRSESKPRTAAVWLCGDDDVDEDEVVTNHDSNFFKRQCDYETNSWKIIQKKVSFEE